MKDWPLVLGIVAFLLPVVAVIGKLPLPVAAGLAIALSAAWTIAAFRKIRREQKAGLWVLLIAPMGLIWGVASIVGMGGEVVNGVLYRDLRATNVATAEALRREIEKRFDVDAPQEAVIDFLREKQVPLESLPQTIYWIPIGQVPSAAWYCGFEETVVVVSFTPDRRFIKATVESRGLGCL